jgi:hypothetical protein
LSFYGKSFSFFQSYHLDNFEINLCTGSRFAIFFSEFNLIVSKYKEIRANCSRNSFWGIFLYHLIDLIYLWSVFAGFKIGFSCRIFRFSRLGVSILKG